MPVIQPPTQQRIKLLIEMLVRGTNRNLLKWQVTADEDAFRLTSSAANVRISRSEGFDAEAQESYVSRRISVLNDKGRVIEEWQPTMQVELQEFDELFTSARRSAYQTDAVLDKLMNDLRASGVT
jgi:hypothetical protein